MHKPLAAVAAVVVTAMLVLGHWAAARIEAGVLTNSAAHVVALTHLMIEPLLQETGDRPQLTDHGRVALDALAGKDGLAKGLASLSLWAAEGSLLFSTSQAAGRHPAPTADQMKRVRAGQVIADLDLNHDDAGEPGKHGSTPMLEVLVPVRATSKSRVIAVAEICLDADGLVKDMARVRRHTYASVLALALAMIAATLGLARGIPHIAVGLIGARTRHGGSAAPIPPDTAMTSDRSEQVNLSAALSTELLQRRIGAELHDGPLQLMQIALMRLHMMRGVTAASAGAGSVADDHADVARGVITDAIRELRNLSCGLVLPEIEAMSLEEALRLAARLHEQRSGSRVAVEIEPLGPLAVPPTIKCCLFRLAQEGLNNAFRHARGEGQTLVAHRRGSVLEVEVLDQGSGMEPAPAASAHVGIGLAGLRQRIEALGGTFTISLRRSNDPERGTRLAAAFDLSHLPSNS